MVDAGGFLLGNAVGYVDIDESGARAALNRSHQDFNNFINRTGSMMQSWGQNISNFGANLTLWTAPVTAAAAVGLNAAASFDDVLVEIAARTGLTGEAMDAVREQALALGRDTKFSATDAANAFLQLTTAGLTAEQAMEAITPTMYGAAAGGMQLAQSADLVTNVMSAFQLQASDLTDVMNSMARAAASSPSTMAEMGDALSSVGGIARSFGLDVDQTSAILAIFAQNGIRGSEAGTQLRSMLRMMTSDTAETRGAWEELGISLYDTNGNVRDLDTVFAELRVAMAALPMEDQIRLSQQLAGSYGIVGFQALMGSEGIGAMQERMAGQADFMSVAEARMASFRGQIISLKGSIETLFIRALTPFMNNVLLPLVKMTIDFVNGLSDWTGQNEALTQTIVSVGAAILALGPTLVLVGKGIQIIGFGLSAIGTIVGFILSPIGLLTAGVAGLAYVFRAPLGNAIQTAFGWFNALRIFVGTFISDIGNFGIGEAILGIFGRGTAERGESTLEGFLTRLGFNRERAQEIVQDVFTAFSWWFMRTRMIFQQASNFISGIFDSIGSVFDIFSSLVSGGVPVLISFQAAIRATFGSDSPITRFVTVAVSNINRFLNAIRPAIREIGTFLGNIFGSVAGDAGSFFSNIFGSELFGQIFNFGRILLQLTNPLGQISLALQFFGVDLMSVFETAMGMVTTFFQTLNNGGTVVDALKATFGDSEFLNALIDGFSNVVNFVTGTVLPGIENLRVWFVDTALPAILNFVTGTAIPAIQGFIAWIGGIWAMVQPSLTSLWDWFTVTALPAAMGFLTGTAIPAVQTFVNWLADIWAKVSPALTSLWDWFVNSAFPAIWTYVTDTAIPAIQGFIKWLGDIWNAVSPHLASLYDWFMTTGLPGIRDFIVNDVSPVISNFIGLLGDIWNLVSPYLADLYDWFMTSGLPAIQTFITETISPIITNFIGLLQDIWDLVSPHLTNFYNWFMTSGLPAIADFLQGPFADAVNFIIGLVRDFLGLVDDAITGARDFIQTGGVQNNLGGYGAAANVTGDIWSGLQSGQYSWGQVGGAVMGALGFAQGINYVPNDMLAMIHEGEAVVPAAYNPYNPNAQTNGLGGGVTVNIGDVYANTLQDAQAIGDSLEKRLNDVMMEWSFNQ